MSVFAKLFGKKSSSSGGGLGDIDLEPPPSPAFNQTIVRLVIFQERYAGRVPLYDSQAIEKIPDASSTPGKSLPESRMRWPRGCRNLENPPASLPPPPPSPNLIHSETASRSKSLPVGQTPPGGQTAPMIASSGGFKYRLSKAPTDIKMLAEMAFGSLPMKSLGVDIKIHEIKNPHQIMMSQVFTFVASKDSNSTYGSRGESFSSQASSAAPQPSAPVASIQNQGNSRFYLHLSALDAAVDAPAPPPPPVGLPRSSSSRQSLQDSLRRCDDFAAEAAASSPPPPSSHTPLATSSTLGPSASHGNLSSATTLNAGSDVDDSLHKSASSAARLGIAEDGEKASSRTLVSEDANLSEEAAAQPMARSKPVDVPVFHLNGPEDEDSPIAPSSSLSSSSAGSSSCFSSPPSQSSYQPHLSASRLLPGRPTGPMGFGGDSAAEWRCFSPSGSTSGGSSVSSALSGSYVSVHKRWMRNQAKSLELVGREGRGPKNALSRDGNGGAGPGGGNSRRNLEALFNSSAASSTRKEPTTKLAFSLVFDLEAPSSSFSSSPRSTVSSSPSAALELHQRATTVLKTFLFTHASLIESHIRVLRETIRSAVVGNKRDFLHVVTTALEDLRVRLADLISSPRLPHPLWLRLSSSSSSTLCNEFSSSISNQHRSSTCSSSSEIFNRGKKSLCHAFLRKFGQVVDRLDTKHSNYFFSSLLTAVLTRHLAWVTTVSPSLDVSSSLAAKSSTRGHYLQKRLAPWLEQWAACNAYNPLWGQLGDLFGAVAFPLKVSQTVIVGSKKEVVKDLLFILSYFIRCSDVVSSVAAAFATDFWDQGINQLLLQESTISNRSGDTIVDAVLGNDGNYDADAVQADFDDKTVEFNDPCCFGFGEDDDDDEGSSPMFRPRSNTVLERRTVVTKEEPEPSKGENSKAASGIVSLSRTSVADANDGAASSGAILSDAVADSATVDAAYSPSSSVRIPRKDSGILLDGDRRRDDDEEEPFLQDSGCFDTLNGDAGRGVCNAGRWKVSTLDDEPKTEEDSSSTAAHMSPLPRQPDAQKQQQRPEYSQSQPLQQESPRKISPPPSTLSVPPESQRRSKTHSIDSQYSSKTSSTCQSDEGFDSIPSEATSKDGSPPLLSGACCKLKSATASVSLSATPRALVDIMDPSTYSGLIDSERTSGLRSRYASSKKSTNVSGASLCDLDVTEVPRLRVDEENLLKGELLCNSDKGVGVGAGGVVDVIASNLGYSLMGNVHETFRPDFALQGTSDRDFVKTKLPQHLHRQLEHSFLDDRVSASCCIVADVDRCVVEVYSTEHSDPTTPIHVTPANMVVGVAESLRDLYNVSSSSPSSSSSLSSSPELCLAHLEDKLQEIFFKSLTFSKLLPTLQQWRGVDRNELRSLVGFEMSDVPLLAAVASTHEENLQI